MRYYNFTKNSLNYRNKMLMLQPYIVHTINTFFHSYSLLLPKPSTNIDSRSYIEQFSSITWTAILLFLVVLMAMLILFNKFGPQDNSGSMGHYILTSLRIFCNMGG